MIAIIGHALRCGLSFMPFYKEVPALPGHVALVSQSGAMGYVFVQAPMRGRSFLQHQNLYIPMNV